MENRSYTRFLLSSTTALFALTFSHGALAQMLELKSTSDFESSYKTARICFLPDCNEDVTSLPDVPPIYTKWCEDHGFNYNSTGKCPPFNYQETCIRDEYYIKCDPVKWCKDNGYVKTSCVVPTYLFNKCPNGKEFYKECKLDEKEACKLENPAYVEKCQNGWRLDDEKLCTYSPTFGICCNKCDGFEYTASNIPQGYIAGERCDGCDGTRYKKVINPCEGYSDCSEYGPAVGSDVCWSGGNKKYKTCKTCVNCEGFDYTASNIPQGYVAGDSCESCNGLKYKIAINPCSGYSDCAGMGPAAGASVCWSGTTKKYNKCETCNYTATAAYCTSDCYSVGMPSCVRNGTTYYSSCTDYKCNRTTQNCNNGTCVCADKFKFTCAGPGFEGPELSFGKKECGGKYEACRCLSGYSAWDNYSNTCKKITYGGNYCCDDKAQCGNRYNECKNTLGYMNCSQVIALCQADGGYYDYQQCLSTNPSIYVRCRH